MSRGFFGERQTTLAEEIVLTGQGVHSGKPVNLTLLPADADTGIVFIVECHERGSITLNAEHKHVVNTQLCTVLGTRDAAVVGTVEHLLAAIRGLGVDNIVIMLDGAEVPIMDGSSSPFVAAIDEVGLVELSSQRRYIQVLKPIHIEEGAAWATLEPHAGFYLDVTIDFDTPTIGCQRFARELSPGVFRAELSRARTFGFMADVQRLWDAGLAHGASLDNTVALDGDRVLNPEGLRYSDEFVRHKALDAVGDLALSGAPLLARFTSHRGGHRMNALALQALFADPEAYAVVEAPRVREELQLVARRGGGKPAGAVVNFAAE
ncbi:MAG: UDP-3-O-acyl-N-acetylglucosamine deacetylase [Pseudomonadota bacterium]